MGQGIQQAPVAQSGGNAWLDVFKVLFEPGAVFERVRDKPNILAPYVIIMAVQLVLLFVNMSYTMVAVGAQATAAGRPAPSAGMIAGFSVVGLVVFLTLVLLVNGLILWVLTSMLGSGESKFSTLLSVCLYGAVPAAMLLSIIGTVVLHLKGTSGITSPQDLQPALGLDLLVPGAKGFMGAVLKGLNPFSIWGLVLTAIGVSTTQRVSKGTGYTIATIAFVIGLLIAGSIGAIFSR
ncbi:MAG TPA: YIP1 family protein [Gemmatimonadales bacterium]|nr:YIP1 family protein [Gemmatimonadales bacterium]